MTNIPIVTLKNGFKFPVLGFGTWQMGNRTAYGASSNDPGSMKAIKAAVEHGVCHIDTAELYGDGYVEEMIARALKDVDRSKLFLTSKVRGQNATKDGIRKAIQGSLLRLNTDYLDLYLIHYRSMGVEIEEGIVAMNDLVDEGLIRNFGVSNFAVESMQKAISVTRHPIVVNQVQYNLQHREAVAKGVLQYCQEHDIICEAWGPVRPINEDSINIPIIKEMCEKYDATPYQIAIAWLINQPLVTTLFKTNHVERLQENIKAVEIKMDSTDVERLREEFPDQVIDSDFPMR